MKWKNISCKVFFTKFFEKVFENLNKRSFTNGYCSANSKHLKYLEFLNNKINKNLEFKIFGFYFSTDAVKVLAGRENDDAQKMIRKLIESKVEVKVKKLVRINKLEKNKFEKISWK